MLKARKLLLLATTACFMAVPVMAAEAPPNASTPKVEKKVAKPLSRAERLKAKKAKAKVDKQKLAPGKDKPQG